MSEGPKPFAQWGTRDWVAAVGCFALASGVADIVERNARPPLDDWSAFAAKVAAGAAVMVLGLVAWGRLSRPRG